MKFKYAQAFLAGLRFYRFFFTVYNRFSSYKCSSKRLVCALANAVVAFATATRGAICCLSMYLTHNRLMSRNG